MARELRFTILAARDVASASDWYEAQRPGLGAEFERIVEASLALIRQVPEAGPVVWQALRRLLLPRFPYALYYRLTEHTYRDTRVPAFSTRSEAMAWARVRPDSVCC